MTTPRFSIAMATYNGERFLQEQLDSLARQALLPYELVVCDDRSSDDTVSILEAFAAKAPFATRIYVNERNLGYGDNFLKAAALCDGDWIAFCDQDDVWREHKLAVCTNMLTRYPHIDLLSHSADQVDEDLKPLGHRVPDHRSNKILGPLQGSPLSVHPGFSCCFRKSLLETMPVDARPQSTSRLQGRQSHDQFIYHIANTYGYTAEFPASLVLYRRHRAAATGAQGTGTYKTSLFGKLKNIDVRHATRFVRMAESAKQHRDFYMRICQSAENATEEFLARSRRAVTYYDFVAKAYMKRAEVHSGKSGLPRRLAPLAHAVRLGAYSGAAGGSGLGLGAFLHDLIRVLVPHRLNA
jgi:glycosyltransferase involved in cell wall biosynthesis